MKYLLTILLIGVAPYVNGAVGAPSGACERDCLAAERIGQDYYIVVRGSFGEIVKLHPLPDSLAISEPVAAQLNAQLADPGSSGAPLSWPAQDLDLVVAPTDGGGSVSTTTVVFETLTEIVIVVTTTYRNGDGEIVHVDVNTIRIPKNAGGSDLPND